MQTLAAARQAADPAVVSRLLDRGRDMLSARRTAEALLMLERAVLVPEAPPEAFGLLAEALLEAGRTEEALRAADTALAARGADGMLRLLRARIRRGNNDARGGLDDAAAAVMADPGSLEAKTLLATCLSEAGRHDEALFFFHQVFEAQPGSALAAAMLAMGFMRANRHEAAEELYALAEGLSGKPRGLVVLRAQNAILAGDAQRAAGMLEAALAAAPDSALWSMLGQAYHRLGLTDRAGEAYAEASALEPGNAYLRHLAVAVGARPAEGDRASEQYVTEVFDGFAARFEESLFSLGYRIPGVMLRILEAHLPDVAQGRARLGDVLDLGCGTGLMGAVLYDLLGGRLVGVDLSPRMLEAAGGKQVYTELRRADVLTALREDGTRYAAILMADLLCYFGALEEVLAAARCRLAPGGCLLFSIEAGEPGTGWVLTRNARYQQSAEYVRSALSQAGLVAIGFREEVLRFENGEPVRGYIVLAAPGH
ncbi:methyltransferase domain-containing protein [Roseococcus sp. SYP-B2431]|uniref:tetratricopeptide repeat protein n=1 Tax=Roseococcus sp. SYP-B2431 TaxID=2496640 RepID=UPI0010395F4F|nr:tetratricopeptide repeat protein [Roseococcus sp. SYP-B2431]TCI00002.1 methyltransferase domain-containing protein [Roseococcus sp. SYP-B2431]